MTDIMGKNLMPILGTVSMSLNSRLEAVVIVSNRGDFADAGGAGNPHQMTTPGF
jgi:hypothetical protein